MLGVQTLACLAIAAWTAILSFLLLKLVDLIFGLRVSLDDEILGADLVEHGVNSGELPGDEEEQRQYVRLMMQRLGESVRGEGDGSLDSNANKRDSLNDHQNKPSDVSTAVQSDSDWLYRQIRAREPRKVTHVFGSRVFKIQNVPAMLDCLKQMNARRFSDEFIVNLEKTQDKQTQLRRSSSLRHFPSDHLFDSATMEEKLPSYLHATRTNDDAHPIPAISETEESSANVGQILQVPPKLSSRFRSPESDSSLDTQCTIVGEITSTRL